MLTTCPECRTAFRVTQEQLGARRGMVRCGRCTAVFNAYDNLQAEIETPEEDEIESPDQARMHSQEFVTAIEPADSAVRAESESQPAENLLYEVIDAADDTAATQAEPPGSAWLAEIADDAVELDAAMMPDNPRARQRQDVDDILLSDLPSSRDADVSGSGILKGLLYGILASLLFVTLLAQTIFFLRAELVTWLPEMRPALAMACKSLGCELPLSRDPEALHIEASSLETDPEQAAHARLRVTFSNRSRQAQDWPHFILKLSDIHNTAMAQRVFKPRDYLAKERGLSAGIAARSEHEFQLDLDLGALSAAGYEVKPYYP